MKQLVERATLYDISRFVRQFLHEQDVQDFHIVEKSDELTVILKPEAAGNTVAAETTFEVSCFTTAIAVRAAEGPGGTAACSSEEFQLNSTETPGLLGWLRIYVAGWLDAVQRI